MNRVAFIRALVQNLQKPSMASVLERIIDETWESNGLLDEMVSDYNAWDPNDPVVIDPIIVRRHIDHGFIYYTRAEDDKILLTVDPGTSARDEASIVRACASLFYTVMKYPTGMEIDEWTAELVDGETVFRRAAAHFDQDAAIEGGHVDHINRRFKLPVKGYANLNRGFYVVDDSEAAAAAPDFAPDGSVDLMFLDFDVTAENGAPTAIRVCDENYTDFDDLLRAINHNVDLE